MEIKLTLLFLPMLTDHQGEQNESFLMKQNQGRRSEVRQHTVFCIEMTGVCRRNVYHHGLKDHTSAWIKECNIKTPPQTAGAAECADNTASQSQCVIFHQPLKAWKN